MRPEEPGANRLFAAAGATLLVALGVLALASSARADDGVVERTYEISNIQIEGELVQPTTMILWNAPPLLPDETSPDLPAIQARMAELAAALEALEGAEEAAALLAYADLDWRAADWVATAAAAESDPAVRDERRERAAALHREAGRAYTRAAEHPAALAGDRARASYMAALVAAREGHDSEYVSALQAAMLADGDSEAGRRAAVLLADRAFDSVDLEAAIALYEQAVGSSLPTLSGYARYKLAWCRYNLADYARALNDLAAVTRLPCPDDGCFAEVAAVDLPLFLASVADSTAEVEAFCASDDVRCPDDIATAVREVWTLQGRDAP